MNFQHIRINVQVDDFLRFARVVLFNQKESGEVEILTPEGPKSVGMGAYFVDYNDSIMVEHKDLQYLVDSLYEQGIRPSQLGSISWLLDLIQTYLAKREPIYEPLK